MPGPSDPITTAFAGPIQIDQLRRWQGLWLDHLGFGPEPTPSRVVLERPGMRLHVYDGASGPPLLIVPAPIKRAYLWDLAPEASVVRRCVEAGLAVHLIEWTDPQGEVTGYGLTDYADRMIGACREAVAAATGTMRVALAGHSLGGTLAALHAALYPDRVRGLVLVEAPLRFGAAAGAFAPLVAATPEALIQAVGKAGTVPGSLIDVISVTAAPDTFSGERLVDGLASSTDPAWLRLHLRVVRWTLDEFPLPGPLFAEIVQRLYKEDRFACGTLELGGRRVDPTALTIPVLTVVNPESRIIPPVSVLCPLNAPTVLTYRGDPGVALRHVGALVGRSAHDTLWPAILNWLGHLPL